MSLKPKVLLVPRISDSDKGSLTAVGTLVFNNTTDAPEYVNLSATFKKLANQDQIDTLTSSVAAKLPLSGGTLTGSLILNADPTSSLEACTKNYADMLIAGYNNLTVIAASTAALTGTYNNGASGVGATFTLTATGAFSLDGQAGVLNALYLLKDQASSAQNGIYKLTTVGAVGVQAVLTRSADYDSPAEITAGDIVNTAYGTVNGGISYLQTATVTAVGTDPITFSRWGGQSMTFSGGDVTGSGFSPVTLTIVSNSVTDAKLRQSSALSIIGNATNSPANVADISAASDGQVLRRSGTALGFGALNLASGNAITGILPNSNTTAASANTASAIVARDGSGNFVAGTITAALTGNASTATTLQNARLINGVSFNGSADITITAAPGGSAGGSLTGTYPNPTIANLAVTNAMIAANTIDLTAKVTGILPNANTTATTANTISTLVLRDASNGGFNAGQCSFKTISILNTGVLPSLIVSSSTTGSTNAANISLDRGDQANGSSVLGFSTFGTTDWNVQTVAGSATLNFQDATNSVNVLSLTKGAGTTSSATFAGNVIVNGLTASQAVVTNASRQLVSLAYSTANTASALVQRDASSYIYSTGLQMIKNGSITVTDFLFMGDSSQTTNSKYWGCGPSGTSLLFYTVNDAQSSNTNWLTVARSGNTISSVNFSSTATFNVTGTVNLTSLTASQVVVTDSSKNLASLAYASANTASALVQRDSSGNFIVSGIGLGTSPIASTITFANSTSSPFPRLVLYSVANNDHQYLGYGISATTLRYQVPDSVTDHVFFAGINSSSSTELFRIKGNTDVQATSGNLIVNTAGKTLKIKQGSNACAGTGAVLVAGTVTVNTTAVATGDIIQLSCTAAGGTQGIVRTSISNGVSFTITSSNGADTSTYSWVIIKAA